MSRQLAIRCGLTDWTYREFDDICNRLGGCAERQKPAWSTTMRDVLPGEIGDRARVATTSLGLLHGGLGTGRLRREGRAGQIPGSRPWRAAGSGRLQQANDLGPWTAVHLTAAPHAVVIERFFSVTTRRSSSSGTAPSLGDRVMSAAQCAWRSAS